MAKVTFTIHKAGKHQRHSRRNQILDAAQRCFKKQGFHKTTLRDIAQEFGMSAGHIYNYFSNKEAIIEALVELRTQEFLDMINTDKFADLPPEERMDKELGQVVDAYLNLDNTSLSIAIMNEALINPKVYEIVVAAASKVRNHIVEAQLLAMKEERRYAPPYEVIESRSAPCSKACASRTSSRPKWTCRSCVRWPSSASSRSSRSMRPRTKPQQPPRPSSRPKPWPVPTIRSPRNLRPEA